MFADYLVLCTEYEEDLIVYKRMGQKINGEKSKFVLEGEDTEYE